MGLPNIFEAVRDEGIAIGRDEGISIGRDEVCASLRSQLIVGGMPHQEADSYVNLALTGTAPN